MYKKPSTFIQCEKILKRAQSCNLYVIFTWYFDFDHNVYLNVLFSLQKFMRNQVMIQDQVKILNFEVVLLVTYWAWILSLGIDDNCLNMNIYRKIDQLEFRDLWEMNFRYSKSYCKTKYFLWSECCCLFLS